MSRKRREINHQEELILAVVKEINKSMDRRTITRTGLARVLGWPSSGVTRVLNGRNITLRTLADIANGLGGRVKVSIEHR